MTTLNRELSGSILDIGGGGEGIIGRLYREQVIAIDNRPEELEETPEGFKKVLMDARKLEFSDCSFDNVTFFYTLMYMSAETQKQALMEAIRVLKPSGEVHIWDCDIISAHPKPFCIDLEIRLPEAHISTTYGVGKMDAQDKVSIIEMCINAGLELSVEHVERHGFYLRFLKLK